MSITNEPLVDYAKEENSRLAKDYAHFRTSLEELRAEAKNQPEIITSDSEALSSGAIIKRFRDLDSRVEAVRVLEAEPYLRRKHAVDAFFFAIRDFIGKRDRKDRAAKPGIADVLQTRIDAYQDEKARAERARLDAIRLEELRKAQEAQREAEAEAAKAREATRIAEEARLKADRARLAETQATKKAAAEAAEQLQAAIQAEANARAREAEAAIQAAEEARLATLVRDADLVRTRGTAPDGAEVLLTSAKADEVLLTDRDAITPEVLAKLLPYFSDKELEKAARGYCKSTSFNLPLAGFEVIKKRKGVTR